MALAVITTPAATDANSYASIAEANAYHETRLHSDTWTTADDATKAVALVEATRLLDVMYEWAEWPTTQTQALQWPRAGVEDALRRQYIDDHTIPQRLKEATAEYARQLIDSDRTADNQVEAQGLKSLTAGSVSLSFKDNVYAKIVPDAVLNLIPYWWGYARSAIQGTRELARG